LIFIIIIPYIELNVNSISKPAKVEVFCGITYMG